MSKKYKVYDLKNKFSDVFELPKDIVLNLPRISIVGNIQFSIENHRGIIEYSDDTIKIGIKDGELIIKGIDLEIKNIYSHEILIEGKFEKIIFD